MAHAKTQPKAPKVRSKIDIDVEWLKYFNAIQNGDHPIDGDRSYICEIEACRKAFNNSPKFNKSMPLDERKLVAGYAGGTTGYLGYMKGALRHGLNDYVEKSPEEIGKYLDKIPFTGDINLDRQVRPYLEGMTSIKGIGMAVATRLLCVKRPDQFLSSNGGSQKSIKEIFNKDAKKVKDYLEIIEIIRSSPWFASVEPEDARESKVWRARVALLDAILYKKVG